MDTKASSLQQVARAEAASLGLTDYSVFCGSDVRRSLEKHMVPAQTKLLYAQIPMLFKVIRTVEAFVLIRAGTSESLNFMKTIKEEIRGIKGVKEVYGIFGRYDLLARVETKTLEDLGNLVTDKIRGINGVLTTETLVIGF